MSANVSWYAAFKHSETQKRRLCEMTEDFPLCEDAVKHGKDGQKYSAKNLIFKIIL